MNSEAAAAFSGPSASPAAARIKIILGAVLFSTGGAAIKASSFTGLQVAGLRAGFACAALFLLIPASRRIRSWRVLPVALAYAITAFLYVLSNKLTTAANATFLQAASPLYLLLFGPLLLRERIRRGDLLFMAAIAAGLGLFFTGTEKPLETAPEPLLGNFLAAASGLTWALTILGLRWLGKNEAQGGAPAASAVLCANLTIFLVSLPWIAAIEESRTADWLLMAYMGTFQIGLAYFFITSAMRRVPAFETSLLLMVEPVVCPLWAFAFHGELTGLWSQFGCALILAATAVQTLRDFRRPKILPG